MHNLEELIAAAKRAVNAQTNTEFGMKLGVSRQTVSNWKRRENTPDERTVAEMARLTDTDAGEALILLQIAKSKTEKERQFWKRFLHHAAIITSVMLLIGLTIPEVAHAVVNIHYAQLILLAWFLTCGALRVKNPSRTKNAQRSVSAALA